MTDLTAKFRLRFGASIWPWLALAALPFLMHLPVLVGLIQADPIYLESGIAIPGQRALFSGLAGYNDPNAGTTTQALGHLAAKLWLSGKVPWWNSFNGVGLPLAAEMQPSALFLPFVLLFKFQSGLLLLKIAMQIVAGFATYALLRRLGFLRTTAAVGGALYELNGVFAWTSHAAMLPIAFLPLLLLGIEQARAAALDADAVLRSRWRTVGWRTIAVAIAFSLYAGFPETAYLDGLLALLWSALRFFTLPPAARSGFGFRVAAGGSIGLIIAAPAIYSFAQYLLLSEHGLRDLMRMTDLGQFPSGFIQYLFPYFYGPIAAFSGQDPSNALVTLWGRAGGYFGTTLFFAALVGLVDGSRERGLRWLLGAWIAVCLAQSGAAPGVHQIFHYIPIMEWIQFFRYAPASWLMAAVILASFSLDARLRNEDNANGLARKFAVVLFIIAAAATLGMAWPYASHLRAAVPDVGAYMIWSLIWGSATFAVAIFLFTHRGRRAPLFAATLLLADAGLLFVFPLLSGEHNSKLNMAAVEFLQKNVGLQRFFTLGPISPNYSAYFEIASINSNQSPVPAVWADYIRTDLKRPSDVVIFTGNETDEAFNTNLEAYRSLGVKYVVASTDRHMFEKTIEAPIKKRDASPIILTTGASISGAIPADLVKPGPIDGFGVAIGTFFGTSSGPLTVKLCADEICVDGSAALETAGDNNILLVDLRPSLPVKAGEKLRYTISHQGGKQVAVWTGASDFPEMEVSDPAGKTMIGHSTRWMLRYNSLGPKVAYRDSRVTIYELENPSPYFEARGGPCGLTIAGRETLEASCDAAALLIRREMMFPGWRVTVNGTEKPLEKIEPLFQGIQLPAGHSQLQFIYSPPGIGWSYILFWFGLLTLVVPGYSSRPQQSLKSRQTKLNRLH